jgi:hypothetical protein
VCYRGPGSGEEARAIQEVGGVIKYFAQGLEPIVVVVMLTMLLVHFGHWSLDVAVVAGFAAYFAAYFSIRAGVRFIARRRNNSN